MIFGCHPCATPGVRRMTQTVARPTYKAARRTLRRAFSGGTNCLTAARQRRRGVSSDGPVRWCLRRGVCVHKQIDATIMPPYRKGVPNKTASKTVENSPASAAWGRCSTRWRQGREVAGRSKPKQRLPRVCLRQSPMAGVLLTTTK